MPGEIELCRRRPADVLAELKHMPRTKGFNPVCYPGQAQGERPQRSGLRGFASMGASVGSCRRWGIGSMYHSLVEAEARPGEKGIDMRALVKYARGRGNVRIQDVPVPEIRADQLLIRIKYCGICGTDLHIYADEFANSPPVVMGHEYCGTVVEVGQCVQDEWSVGDRVVGELHTGACGKCELCLAGQPHICDRKLALGSRSDGAFAEYLALRAWLAHRVPDGIPWEVAGVTEPFAITTHCLIERGGLGEEESVLISGSATMGLMATIWASRLGIREIIVSGTTMDKATRFPLAREMGATRVISVQEENLEQIVLDLTEGRGVDAWIDCSGSPAAITAGLDLVRKRGKVVLIGLVGPEAIPIAWNALLYKELDLAGCFSSPPSSWQRALAAEVEEAAKLRKLVTRIIPLQDWREGFEMLRRGEAVKILIKLEA